MLNILMSHSKFNGYLKQCPPSHDLRDVMATIKQKVSMRTQKYLEYKLVRKSNDFITYQDMSKW